MILLRAWRLASRIRSANVIWTGRASDVLPSSRRDLEAIARWCGYGQGNAAALEEDYLRRNPDRVIDARRTRHGSREFSGQDS